VSSHPRASLGALAQSDGRNPVRGRRHLFKSTSPKQARRPGAPGILSEEGSNLVETALTIGILMTLLIGLLQITLAAYAYHYVSYAAREATRWAIVRGANCTGLTGCGAANSDIKAYVQNLGYPGIDPANLDTTTTWYTHTIDPTTNTVSLSVCGTDPDDCNLPQNQVKVLVTYNLSLNIPFVRSATIPITSTSAMMISQ